MTIKGENMLHYGVIPLTGLANDIEKERASRHIRNRVYKGQLKRGCCLVCGSANAIAHHYDYNKPLDIFWLCRRHHLQLHRCERKGTTAKIGEDMGTYIARLKEIR